MRELPEGWIETTLGGIAEINPRESIKKGSLAKAVAMEKLASFDKKITGFEMKEFKGGTKFRNGDTLLARITPCLENGKTAYVDILDEGEAGFGSTEYIVIREKEGLSDKQFLFYLATSPRFREIAIKCMTGTSGRQRVQTDVLINKPLFLPTLPEQKAIADMLSSFDEKIELLREQNKTLETLAQTIFKEWFVHFNFPDLSACGSPAQADATGEMVDSELGEIPKGWRVSKLADLIKTNASSINKNSDLDIIQYLDTGSLTEGYIESTQELHLVDAPSRARRIVQHNDVLLSTVRPNLKHYGIMKNPDEKLIVSTGFCVMTCDEIDPHFVYYLLTTNEMTDYLHSVAEGSTSTYPSIKPSDIENVEFILPPEDILKLFSDYADKAWDKIMFNQKQIRSLSEIRDTLLPKLMNGEIRMKNSLIRGFYGNS